MPFNCFQYLLLTNYLTFFHHPWPTDKMKRIWIMNATMLIFGLIVICLCDTVGLVAYNLPELCGTSLDSDGESNEEVHDDSLSDLDLDLDADVTIDDSDSSDGAVAEESEEEDCSSDSEWSTADDDENEVELDEDELNDAIGELDNVCDDDDNLVGIGTDELFTF
ncbi:hypothetical protein IW261DRAFT_1610730 [Armillaria novae-zelandiae]|uniref:Uncharacterized protein n=1 Tax=Armillaria novae-zelandiae TaxID=153914 RepID=A0AA39NXV4_9AGAR|nr:hypothetical protein IW261DRAFT_1610730 [Armillaria novae-zelandiae]